MYVLGYGLCYPIYFYPFSLASIRIFAAELYHKFVCLIQADEYACIYSQNFKWTNSFHHALGLDIMAPNVVQPKVILQCIFLIQYI